MATVLQAPENKNAKLALQAVIWLAGVVIVAILTAWFTYLATEKSNRNSAIEQQRIAAVDSFDSTGADLDVKLGILSDAIVDGRDIDLARQEVRTAITVHSAKAKTLTDVLGTGNVDAYVDFLAELRSKVDATTDSLSAMEFARLHTKLVVARQKLSEIARKRASRA